MSQAFGLDNQKNALQSQIDQQKQQYGNLAPFRDFAVGQLGTGNEDNSGDYVDPTNPYAAGGSGKFAPITTSAGRYTGQQDKAMSTVMDAPDRSALVKSYLADYDAQDAPKFAADQRATVENAARGGRMGAGMTTNDLTGVLATHNRDRATMGTNLINQAVSGTLQDRLNQLGAARGANESDLGLQTGQQAFQKGLGSEAVGYRTQARAARDAARNNAVMRAGQTANIGFNPSQMPNYMPMANFYGDQAAGWGSLLKEGLKAGLTHGAGAGAPAPH